MEKGYVSQTGAPYLSKPAYGAVLGVLWVLSSPTVLAQNGPTPVNTIEVATAPLHEEIPLTGSVTARRVSRLSPKVEGFVAEVLVDEGDMVRAGDELLRLDPIMAEIDLSRAQAQLDEASARLKDAQRQRREARQLVKQQHIASTDYESSIAQVEINSTAQQRLQAELSRQQKVLARHSIYAPFDGVVSEKLIEVGQWVETSTTVLELVEFSVLRIELPVPQLYFSQVEIGTTAESSISSRHLSNAFWPKPRTRFGPTTMSCSGIRLPAYSSCIA